MKNLNQYNLDSFDVHKRATNSKRDADLKQRISAEDMNISEDYNLFTLHNQSNTIEQIPQKGRYGHIKDDLNSLYEYDSKTIREFRSYLKNLQPPGVKYTCQFCTLSRHDTLDHILPQSKYSEYSVHPLNLIPSCTACNREKSSIVSSPKKFLNFYLDNLPDIRYLYIDIKGNDEKDFHFDFTLKNQNRIDFNIYGLIVRHFDGLGLLSKFKNAAIDYYPEFFNLVKRMIRDGKSIEDIRKTVIEDIQENVQTYGHNYWKCALQTDLINSDLFISICEL